MPKIIGIDLGTTNSVVAVMEGDSPKVLTNANGARTTPSVVAYTDKGEQLVGQLARNQQVANPKNTIFSIKRLMGRRHGEVASEEKPYVVSGGHGEMVKVAARGKTYTPPEISAAILVELKKAAEDYLGYAVEKAVITVPAYFNDSQRKATKDAGKIAGLQVERIINEPTAAGVAYGLDKKKEQTIAVFDLGGGTFDISILEIDPEVGTFEVRGTSGDGHLGGDDYDEALLAHVAEDFRAREGIDLRADPMALQRLKEACEKAKCELSSSLEASLNLPYITADASGPKHLQMTVTRSLFERLTESLTSRCRGPAVEALKAANVSPKDIDEVVLVGGSTRIPAVQALCKEIFGREPNKGINPDEVVALGAAVQGAILSGDKDDIVLLDVTPLTLGVETMGGVTTTMIEANTTIPTSKTETYSTATDGQTEVTIHVLQGNRSMAIDNRTLGRFNLSGIPPAPRGLPQIDVTFDIDANGIISVSAKDKATSKEQSIKIEGSSGLSDADIERMKREAEEHTEDDAKRKELAEIRNRADHAAHAAETSLKEHRDKLTDEQAQPVEAAVATVKEALKGDDSAAIEASLNALGEASQQIGKVIYEQVAAAQNTAGEQAAQETVEQPEDVIDAEFTEKTDEADSGGETPV